MHSVHSERSVSARMTWYAKKRGLNTLAYTGYTFEELISGASEKNGWREFLEKLDLIVDGRFVLEEKSLDLTFKGSKNQRIIDVKRSLEAGKAVLSEYDSN